MINNNELIILLNKYGIDGKKLIKNNPNVLIYGKYNQIKDILKLDYWKYEKFKLLLTPTIWQKYA